MQLNLKTEGYVESSVIKTLSGACAPAMCLYAQNCGSVKIIKSGFILFFSKIFNVVSTQTIITSLFFVFFESYIFFKLIRFFCRVGPAATITNGISMNLFLYMLINSS